MLSQILSSPKVTSLAPHERLPEILVVPRAVELAGPLRTPLGLAQWKRASCPGKAGTSGFLLCWPRLGTEHLPGALCSGTGSPALGLCSP